MTYIIWALLNIVVLITLCVFLYKAIKTKLGGFSAGFAVFLLLAFTGSSSNEGGEIEPNSNRLKTWRLISHDSLNQEFTSDTNIVLEKNIFHRYSLGIIWSTLKDTQKKIPSSANSWTTGLSVGTKWNPLMITTSKSDIPGSFKYDVVGTLKWSIIGITIYSQPKHWSGFVSVN